MKKTDLVLMLGLMIFFACSRTDHSDIEKKQTSYGKNVGPCNCAKQNESSCTDDCIVKSFMNEKDTREFTVTWESCDNNSLNGSDCQGAKGAEGPNGLPYTSKVKFCYGNWVNHPGGCTLLMEIDNVPPCMRCLSGATATRCLKFNAVCEKTDNGNGTETTVMNLTAIPDDEFVGEGTDINGYQWTVTTETGDPKIKICCERMEGNWPVHYCCTGDMPL